MVKVSARIECKVWRDRMVSAVRYAGSEHLACLQKEDPRTASRNVVEGMDAMSLESDI